MTYEIREQPDHTHRLYRHGELVAWEGAIPSNAEFEFWCEIERLREQRDALQKACRMAEGVFARQSASESRFVGDDQCDRFFMGDDEHEAWAALTAALKLAEAQ